MHTGILAAWIPAQFVGADKLGWFVGVLVVGWLGVRWWSAQIAQQFDREPPQGDERVNKKHEPVEWKLGGLLTLLLLLFVLALVILAVQL
jgi:hypothetical protein